MAGDYIQSKNREKYGFNFRCIRTGEYTSDAEGISTITSQSFR